MTDTPASAQTIVVTGGAQGIGFSIARRLAAAGYGLAIADLRGAAEAAARIGPQARGFDVDVSDAAAVAQMMEAAGAVRGGIHGLVNNAALYTSLRKQPFEAIPLDEWRRVFQVNVEGVFNCCRSVAPQMRKAGGGSIVNLSSATVLKGNPLLLHYVASKSAVLGMTRALAREFGEWNVRVNAVSPGLTLSDGILNDGTDREAQKADIRRVRAIHRDMHPADVVGAVAFLMGPESEMFTGQNLVIDGGMTMN
jgi:NAD(P)-dependent dehydrogenase (short-subunit alcohol dehydrogenase family)